MNGEYTSVMDNAWLWNQDPTVEAMFDPHASRFEPSDMKTIA